MILRNILSPSEGLLLHSVKCKHIMPTELISSISYYIMYIKKLLKGDVITLCNADVAMVLLCDREKYLC